MVSADKVTVPEVAFVPDHAPDAVQLFVLLLFQVSVDAPLYATLAGFALSVTVGAGGGDTVMDTDCETLPPAPLHVNV